MVGRLDNSGAVMTTSYHSSAQLKYSANRRVCILHTFKTAFPQAAPVQGEDLKSPPEDLSGEEEGKGKGEDGEVVKVEVDQIEQVVRVDLFTIEL